MGAGDDILAALGTQAPQPKVGAGDDILAALGPPAAQQPQGGLAGRMAYYHNLQQQMEAKNPEQAIPAFSIGGLAHTLGQYGVGVAGGIAGIPGDLEQLLRWSDRGHKTLSPQNILPTGSDVQNALAGPAQNGADRAARFGGSLAAPMIAGEVVKGVRGAANVFTSRMQPPDVQANNLLSRALSQDNVSPQNAADTISQFGPKPSAVMDVGGTNTARLARTVNTLPGEGSDTVGSFLAERQADQGGRVLGDISSHLSSGSDPYTLTEKMLKERATTSAPLYQAAGIPAKPVDYPSAPLVDTPEVTRLLDKSGDVKSAIAQAKRLPDYADLPDNSIVLLDKAYKNIGGSANAARVAGNNESARDLDSLRVQLRNAITGGDPQHPYQLALNNFSSRSDSLDAVRTGQDFLKSAPEELASTIKDMTPADRDFFRVGAARALQDRVNNAADSADVVKRIFGNKTIRSQINVVFGKDAANNFAFSMTPEKLATMTNQFVRGGSNTANKLADVSDATGQMAQDAASGFVHGGPTAAIMRPLLNQAQAHIGAFFNGMTPPVRAALGNLLTQTGPEASATLSGLANAGQSAIGVGNANVGGFSSVLNSPVFRVMLARHAVSIPPILFGREPSAQ